MARIRKAVVAALGAASAAAGTVLTDAGRIDRDVVARALGAGLVAAALTGWATWKVRNAAS